MCVCVRERESERERERESSRATSSVIAKSASPLCLHILYTARYPQPVHTTHPHAQNTAIAVLLVVNYLVNDLQPVGHTVRHTPGCSTYLA